MKNLDAYSIQEGSRLSPSDAVSQNDQQAAKKILLALLDGNMDAIDLLSTFESPTRTLIELTQAAHLIDRQNSNHLDPARIELFVDYGLKDVDVIITATHLGRCPDCKKVFEAFDQAREKASDRTAKKVTQEQHAAVQEALAAEE